MCMHGVATVLCFPLLDAYVCEAEIEFEPWRRVGMVRYSCRESRRQSKKNSQKLSPQSIKASHDSVRGNYKCEGQWCFCCPPSFTMYLRFMWALVWHRGQTDWFTDPILNNRKCLLMCVMSPCSDKMMWCKWVMLTYINLSGNCDLWEALKSPN